MSTHELLISPRENARALICSPVGEDVEPMRRVEVSIDFLVDDVHACEVWAQNFTEPITR